MRNFHFSQAQMHPNITCGFCSTLSRIKRRGKCGCRCVIEHVCAQVRHGSRCRSVYERARGSGAGRGLIQQLHSAPERTAPDRLSSTPGTLPTTAGDWPTAYQSALAPPPCPMRTQKHRRVGHFFFLFFFFLLTAMA